MVAAISGGAPTGDLATFAGLASREAQLVWVAERATAAQFAYNNSDPAPTTTINRVAAQLTSSGVAVQASANLADNAISLALWEGVQALVEFDDAVASEGAPSGDLAEFAALDNIFAQLVYVASGIQSAENAYITANPTETINAITVAPNFDTKLVAVSAILPIDATSLADLVALPY